MGLPSSSELCQAPRPIQVSSSFVTLASDPEFTYAMFRTTPRHETLPFTKKPYDPAIYGSNTMFFFLHPYTQTHYRNNTQEPTNDQAPKTNTNHDHHHHQPPSSTNIVLPPPKTLHQHAILALQPSRPPPPRRRSLHRESAHFPHHRHAFQEG
jgi:hypothetical protein